MKLGLIGLGKMGGNMARRLCRGGIQVVGYNRSRDIVDTLATEEGMATADSVENLVKKLGSPRIAWLMLPAGEATEEMIGKMKSLLGKGDIVVDGGNSNYHDSERRGALLHKEGIHYVDVGTSGGIWGLKNGYCMMVGGSSEAVAAITPALKVLAPKADTGWAHVGPIGAGHFTKMIHNGIEYGMMQAYAEGLALLKGKTAYQLNLAQITELWRHGSVVRSWLLDLTAASLAKDQTLQGIAPVVPDSGEGRWTAIEAIDQGLPAPVMTLALHMRFASQDKNGFGNRLLAMMRNAFGGHAVKKAE